MQYGPRKGIQIDAAGYRLQITDQRNAFGYYSAMAKRQTSVLSRRRFIQSAGFAGGGVLLAACSGESGDPRYTADDRFRLQQQREQEQAEAGRGLYGPQVYRGYRGLAELPWFSLADDGMLVCHDEQVPRSIDVHAHLGISVLMAPDVDLHAKPARVRHLLDCDDSEGGCTLDLDVYANGNFTEERLRALRWSTIAQGLWGSSFAETQTIPGLMDEMDAMRVEHAFILPIKTGMPFGDDLTERWRRGISVAGAGRRLTAGQSVHPHSDSSIAELREHAGTGARLVKLHPTVQSFYPDDPAVMPLYEEAQQLGVVVFFHGGRAGIEPESRHRYALPRHYEAVLANFPNLQVILGHAGARDGEAMLELALRYDNAWLGIHGQSVSRLEDIIRRTNGERLLFGTDWPFYHMGMSLAKVLLCTEQPGRKDIRENILRNNALTLFPELGTA